MSDWYDATITVSRPAAHDLVSLHLDVSGTPLRDAHEHPGQYVKLSLDGLEGYFAIASAPDERSSEFEFLIKHGTPLTDALVRAQVGTKVRIGLPTGGFPLAKARGRRVLLFATGSGISAIRPAVQAICQDRAAFREVTLYFGARTPHGFAYEHELERWQKDGIRVVRTVSQRGAPGWKGLEGYVQTHVDEVDLQDAVAFVCGQKEMVQQVTAVLRGRGLGPDAMFVNF